MKKLDAIARIIKEVRSRKLPLVFDIDGMYSINLDANKKFLINRVLVSNLRNFPDYAVRFEHSKTMIKVLITEVEVDVQYDKQGMMING